MKGYMFAALAASIWAGFILVSRQGGVSELLSYDVIAIRYGVCGLLLLPVWWLKYRINLLQPKLLMASLVGGLTYALFAFNGFERSLGSHAAILLPGVMPLCILVLSSWVNKESYSLNKWLGMILITVAISGLVLEQGVSGDWLGNAYLMLAGLCWSMYSVLIKRWSITPWESTIGLGLITGFVYLPIYFLALPKALSLESLPRLANEVLLQGFYQGFLATIVQMMLFVRAVQLIGPSNMGVVIASVPVVAGFSALYVFNEPATPALLWGFVLITFGGLLVHINIRKLKDAIR